MHVVQLNEAKHKLSVISMADVGGSNNCSGSAAADDLGSGQQGGSSADPGVDMIELFLPRMYVLCVPLCKLHRCKTRPCTHVLVGIRLPGCILHDRALVHTRLPRWDLNYPSFAHVFMLSGVGICLICEI